MGAKPTVATSARGLAVLFGAKAAILAAALVMVPSGAHAAGGGTMVKSGAVTFEADEGGGAERLILTEKAAERLGIEIGEISEATISRRQMVGGFVIPPVDVQPDRGAPAGTFGGFEEVATAVVPKPAESSAVVANDGKAWVLVTLSDGEWERLAKEQPARVMPLSTSDISDGGEGSHVLAKPTGIPPIEDIKRSMLTLYYSLPDEEHGLEMNTRVRVELQLDDDGAVRTVMPYGAVYYDAKGGTWAYVQLEPLVYQRVPIKVERIVGDVAILTEAPPVGTPIVTVGAALLYGAEVYFRN